jgi:hypothetical protein
MPPTATVALPSSPFRPRAAGVGALPGLRPRRFPRRRSTCCPLSCLGPGSAVTAMLSGKLWPTWLSRGEPSPSGLHLRRDASRQPRPARRDRDGSKRGTACRRRVDSAARRRPRRCRRCFRRHRTQRPPRTPAGGRTSRCFPSRGGSRTSTGGGTRDRVLEALGPGFPVCGARRTSAFREGSGRDDHWERARAAVDRTLSRPAPAHRRGGSGWARLRRSRHANALVLDVER